jgi:NADH dehydrogenase FAD-containing subunit
MKSTKTVIVGAGFAGLYLGARLRRAGKDGFLIVAPEQGTVSDKSYYNFRSRGVMQQSLKASMRAVGRGKGNDQLINVLVRNIDRELTELSHITRMRASYLWRGGRGSAAPAPLSAG